MRLLDLFCGAGGCAVGYYRAGFTDITGVDIRWQKHYPFKFVACDALSYLAKYGRQFDVIHASPPCQRFSVATKCRPDNKHADLLTPTLGLLKTLGRPWIVENVMGAPLTGVILCGLMFGLKVFRHRVFQSSCKLWAPEHPSHKGIKIGVDGMVCVAGHGSTSRRNRQRTPADHRNKAAWERGMGIDWMTRNRLSQAIPPAYTKFLGEQLLKELR